MKSITRTAFAVLTLIALNTGSVLADDAALFAAYDQVNSADIEIAELGAIKGESPEVRALAVMVLRDHATVRQMARDIAEDSGIKYTVPTDNDSAVQHKATRERLQSLDGAAFDRAYLAHEAQFHTAAIKAVKTALIPGAKSEEFRNHLKAVLPGFEHHLNATLETAKALGYEIN